MEVRCLACLARRRWKTSLNALREKVRAREGTLYHVVVIQEAGLDGFWIHRALEAEGWITSHVVDAASIAVSRRHRRAKTDQIDGEALIRTLMAWVRMSPGSAKWSTCLQLRMRIGAGSGGNVRR